MEGAHTVDVLWLVEIDPQYPAVGESDDEDVVGSLAGHKVGGNRELKLDRQDLKDRVGRVGELEVGDSVGGGEAAGQIERHWDERVMASGHQIPYQIRMLNRAR